MYGFQPRAPILVGLKGLKVKATIVFLHDMQEMLLVARENVKTAQDIAQFYANQKRLPRVYEEGAWVYLRIPKDPKVLKTGKCPKISPHYAGPSHIVKKLHRNAYQLELPQGVRVHPVFHISRLKE
ncbi:hypothetical protein O6H91_02G053700 [Diphasiastrum complanatum]|uniref:Uncharacterized protein n=1 Tax=Diphasiastrum complanatum TaxID=34168 RepID=A0ACC2EFK5_DIPCM|nr:hypothetical protein O6H91_02G053700 [Diphasiastrum complanatum]